MSKRIAVIGAGAVGGYVGAHMTAAGHDVTLIDPWPDHVEQMQAHGLEIYGMTPAERMTVKVNAMHLTEVQNLAKQKPIDIAFVSVKSYDTVWATTMFRQYLSASGCVVSMQNCINEERVAGVIGWGRTLGCIVTGGVGVDLYQPGHIRRGYAKRADITSFYIGEPSGKITHRSQAIAEIMSSVDAAKATDNLWGERWTKLCVNGMRNGVSAATGMGGNARDNHPAVRRVCIQLAGESVLVGQKLGYRLGKVGALPVEMLAKATQGDSAAYAEIERLMTEGGAGQAERSDYQRPSMAQDMEKGRRTEIEFMNGFIASEAARVGMQAPTHEMLTRQVLRVERGEIPPRPENVLLNT
ncbi:ketopantoate reductase family protein [Rhodopila sp.]|uniref:ketopantoate reductase family protein n=1 Tax=Rhodopila sp. TaxID=2480087 RepID=UPI003D0FD675